MKELKLTLKYTKAYGRVLLYPECSFSKLIIKLTRKTAFTATDVHILQDMGFELNFVYENEFTKE